MNRTEYIGKLNALYVGEKNCLEELITAYDEKDKEIERIKNINEEHRILNGELRKELQQKENIIKEAKEYIELIKTLAMVDKINIFSISKFKEILDKGSEKE